MQTRAKIITGIVFVLVLAGTVFFFASRSGTLESVDENPEPPKTAPAIAGEVACLPLKTGDVPADDTCIKGLRNDRGLYIELQNKPQNELVLGEQIEVQGEFKPPAENSEYAVSGTVRVE